MMTTTICTGRTIASHQNTRSASCGIRGQLFDRLKLLHRQLIPQMPLEQLMRDVSFRTIAWGLQVSFVAN